jgi:HAD superfamily hydrolase (TIGR01549 family)
MVDKFDIIAYDIDNTLLDTYAIFSSIQRDVVEKVLGTLDSERYQSALMQSNSLQTFLKNYGVNPADFPIEDMTNKITEKHTQELTKDINWIASGKEVLEKLSTINNIKLGLLTASFRCMVEAMDQSVQISSYVDAVVTRDDVGEKLKPHPRGLQILQEALNVESGNFLYIGDALHDLEAAHKAGWQAGMIVRPNIQAQKEEFKKMKQKADFVFRNHLEILS